MIRIRDPIHGSIRLSNDELEVVDHRVFQRLRGIKQLGFADQAFPGATHTRYAHGIGAMEVGSRMFDAVFPVERSALPERDRARLRQMLRLAVLLHDIGHPPASHASETAMPLRGALGLACHSPAEAQQQATHEDYTLKLLLESPLSGVLRGRFGDLGIEPTHIAHLVSRLFPACAPDFVVDGVDYFPLLHQMVSGEMDADRMDYLQRDSFFAGVSYGKFDQSWLLENLGHHVVDDQAVMALTPRAVFAFEDFLLSRYHMFVSVYYHYIAVGYDTMLTRYYAEATDEFRLPTDAAGYISIDDVTLWSTLRRSSNSWARRIAQRAMFKRVLEVNSALDLPWLDAVGPALTEASIPHFVCRDQGVLSKYYGSEPAQPIYVVDRALSQARPINAYSRIYERYAQPTHLVRVYVLPEKRRAAQAIIDGLSRGG